MCKMTQMVEGGTGLEPHPQVPSINAFPANSPLRFRDAAIQML